MTKTDVAEPEFEIVVIKGVEYKVRELTVDETDTVDEAAKQKDGSVDGKLSTRLAICAATEPAISPDEIGRMGTTKYTALIRAFNKMNTLPNDQSPTG